MLNPFPDLFTYGLLGATLIRITIGAFFFYSAVQHYRGRKETAQLLSPLMGALSKRTGIVLTAIEMIVGLLLVMGAWTQIVAIVAIVLCIKSLLLKSKLTSLAPFSHSTYILLLVMSLSLLVLGGGAFGFDIPML